MAACCPPSHGCNAPGEDETCALTLLMAAAPGDRDAARALDRWEAFEACAERGGRERERRFRRRAFERARDRALIRRALRLGRAPTSAPATDVRPHARRLRLFPRAAHHA